MTLASLNIRDRTEYEQASAYEAALRAAVDAAPGWLYDASEVGGIIDDLDHARSLYEREHRAEPRIETAGPDAYNRAEDARITTRIATEYPEVAAAFSDAPESGGNR